MKYLVSCAFLILSWTLPSCTSSEKKLEENQKDSIENAELQQVDRMRHNEDSLLKEKEKELLEKYK